MDNQKNVLFYSYEEYTQNYEKEFQSFLEKHSNAREEDFLDNLEYYYKSSFYNEQGGFIEGIIVDKKNLSGYDESIMQFDDFTYTVDSYLMLYIGNDYEFSIEEFEKALDIAENHRYNNPNNEPKSNLELDCQRRLLTKKQHLKFGRFIVTDEKGKITSDSRKYADFKFSVERILSDIQTKRNSIENKTYTQIDDEILDDYSDIALKQKLIILHKLGVIDFIKTIQIQPDNRTHTANILASILGEKGETIKSYLNPMLTEDINNTSNNNPYYRKENEEEAKRIIKILKIKSDKVNL